MDKVTRVLLVRQGETIWNREGRMQGHLDSELTPRGEAQALAVANRLRGCSIAAIYSSDLGRAFRTAEHIAEAVGVPVIAEGRLRERHLGVFQGFVESEILERYPEEWKTFLTRDPEYRIPGGESSRDRVDRSKSLLDDVARNHAGETVLFVTHGGILDGIFRLVVGLPLEAPRQFKIWNAGVNVISRPVHRSLPSSDTGPLVSGGPASASTEGWMIELWGDTGKMLPDEVLDDT